MGGLGLFIAILFFVVIAIGDKEMIYKTGYGEFNGKYTVAKGGVYWLTEPIIHKGMGYALLHKTYRGSYEVIKILRM